MGPVSPAPALAGAAAALLYGTVAVAMGFVNKAVMNVYGLRESNFILLAQMVATVVLMSLLRDVLGVVSFPAINPAQARRLAPVAILYNANVAFALASLGRVSIPTYNAVKRLTPAVVMACNRAWRLAPDPSRAKALSVAVIVLGCVVAGAGDLEFDLGGYVSGFASCLLQAAYLIAVDRTGAERGVGSAELMTYNALLSAPLLLLATFATGELSAGVARVTRGVAESDGGFLATFASALFAGALLNFSLFLCTLANSALTTTVVGVLKGVASTLLGFFLLGGVKMSGMHVAGIAANTAGGIAYTVASQAEKRRARAAFPK
jgi:solute carrier family 35 protein